MLVDKQVFSNMVSSPVRSLRGRVEIYNGSTLALICGCHDRLKSFTVERVGEQGKFFGFGVCQKLNAILLDKNRELSITTANSLEIEFGVGADYIYPCPKFYVTEVHRNENNNELSITAYDALYKAAEHTVGELTLNTNYTIKDFVTACAAFLGLPIKLPDDEAFNLLYMGGANFDGTETIREALNAAAEATQTIYYINRDWELSFIRLDESAAPVATINRENYFTLDSGTNRRLAAIVSATELGDNVKATSTFSGSTQYVRDNPFWELRDDVGELVSAALARVAGLTINQFTLSWRGNFLLEIGDKVALITKDGASAISYILDDTFSFDGSLSGNTQWSYTNEETETEANPASLGEAIKQTFARVDKVNREIELVASEVDTNKTAISALQINTESINASVSKVETKVTDAFNGVNESIAEITKKVDAQITSEEVKLTIQEELSNGVDKVSTGKGFTFDDSGLTIEDINPNSNKAIKTTVSNNGMIVYADGAEVLTANDEGVQAKDLHATTYLIIGENSRLEDYKSNRTACFWIGG